MDFTSTLLFPTRLERLWEVFGDPQYTERKQIAIGASSVAVRHFAVTPQLIEVELEREMPVAEDTAPSWFRTWFGSRHTLHDRMACRRIGPRRFSIERNLDPVGQPVSICGTGWFTELIPGLVRMRVDWRVTSTLPALGDQVERLFTGQLGSMLRRDRAFTVCYAADAEMLCWPNDTLVQPVGSKRALPAK